MIYLFLAGTLFLSISYALFLAWIAYQWHTGQRNKKTNKPLTHFPTVSIIIPARDEAEVIAECLQSMLHQHYPPDHLEMIVINDHSTDKTAAVVAGFRDPRVTLLTAEKHGKKAALQQGIAHAGGALIVTTDADIVAGGNWINTLAKAYQNGARMILAPVKMKGSDNLLTAWQGLDVCGTMLLTGAAVQAGHPLLANGANLAFAKNHFYDLGGYQGNEHRASGDDIFLLQKAVQAEAAKISFAFSPAAVVVTRAESSWQKLFWQRLRWAGKTGAYRDPWLVVFQAAVFGLCVGLITGALLLLWWPAYALWVATAWAMKLLAEYFYLRYACRKMGEPEWVKWLPLVQVTHPFYLMIIGTLALLPIQVRWKERRIR